MINIAGTSGEMDKEAYSKFFCKLRNKKQQHMPKEKVQGKVTFNIKAFNEYNHQRPLLMTLQDHKRTSSRRQMHAN